MGQRSPERSFAAISGGNGLVSSNGSDFFWIKLRLTLSTGRIYHSPFNYSSPISIGGDGFAGIVPKELDNIWQLKSGFG
jgi:hypothetical protein